MSTWWGKAAVTNAVLPLLRASCGRILFISSVNGRISLPLLGAQCVQVRVGGGCRRAEAGTAGDRGECDRAGPDGHRPGAGPINPSTRWEGRDDTEPARALYSKHIAGMRKDPAVAASGKAAEKVADVVERR